MVNGLVEGAIHTAIDIGRSLRPSLQLEGQRRIIALEEAEIELVLNFMIYAGYTTYSA